MEMMCLAAPRNSSYSGSGSLTPGKRSEMMPSKRGTSGERNWSGGEREREGGRERGRERALALIIC